MAKYVKKEGCPRCHSKDNVAVYSDGSKWCFGCRWSTRPPKTLDDVVKDIKEPNYSLVINNPAPGEIKLPEDCFAAFPKQPAAWLDQWDLTKLEMVTLKPTYSPSKELLIFPVYDKERNLQFWQGRYFGTKPGHPKYITEGAKNFMHLFGIPGKPHMPRGNGHDETICVAEDLISARKISRVVDAMPLFGCVLSRQQALRLNFLGYEHLVLWLDSDKDREALLMRQEFLPIFKSVRLVMSMYDPKNYETTEIEEFVWKKSLALDYTAMANSLLLEGTK